MPSSGTRPASRKAAITNLNLDVPVEDWAKEEGIDENDIRERLTKAADAAAADRAERFGSDIMAYVERSIVLQTLDHLWREHLVNLEHLRSVVGFRGYAQRDPLNEYKGEAFELFQAMLGNLRQAVTAQLMRVELVRQAAEAPPPEAPRNLRPPCRRHHGRGRFRRRHADADPRRDARRAGRGARPEGSLDLGQDRPQRGLPVRLRQEVQALPRRVWVRRA